MSEFKDKYKVPITENNIDSLKQSMYKAIINLLNEMIPFSNPEIQNYLHNMIATIMLEHQKYYEGFDIKTPYRFKSEKSKYDKTIDFVANESEFDYDERK